MMKNMLKKYPVGGLCVLLAILMLPVTPVAAQSPLPPPISPWLSMFNRDRGNPLSNYHTYVRPQQQAIQEFQSLERQAATQRSQQQTMQNDMDKILNQPRKSVNFGSQRAAGYGQYLHYYQGVPRRPVPYYSTGARR